jgi:hypothetical protein
MDVCKKISYHTRIVQFSWEMLNYQLYAQGVSPPLLWLSRCDNSRLSATSSSLSGGAAWEDRHCPLLPSYQHLEFHIDGKGIPMKINQVKFTIHTKIKTGYSIFMVCV